MKNTSDQVLLFCPGTLGTRQNECFLSLGTFFGEIKNRCCCFGWAPRAPRALSFSELRKSAKCPASARHLPNILTLRVGTRKVFIYNKLYSYSFAVPDVPAHFKENSTKKVNRSYNTLNNTTIEKRVGTRAPEY